MNFPESLTVTAVPSRGIGTPAPLDVARVREDFPALHQEVQGKPLIYLDNAASTQKPRAMLEALVRYYQDDNANVHRGVHTLGDRATSAFEAARVTVQRFLHAASPKEIVFVRGATEAINLVAQTFGRQRVGPGDEVVTTWMEHHANIVPWQMLCQEKGAKLQVVPITDDGDLDLDAFERLLGPRTRMVAVTHVSNILGTINPVRRIIEMAHRRGIPVLVDGAQGVPHLDVNVRQLDCDFYVFSGHKVYAPMGIGVLYGKLEHLEAMPPWQGGGDMVDTVRFEETTYNAVPQKFEAGTPNVADAVGLAASLRYLEKLGRDSIREHEERLLEAAVAQLREIPGVRIIGEPAHRAGVVSFVVEDPPLAALDLGAALDLDGIAVRTGHHCGQPLMRRMGVPGTVRASFALYNTMEEVDALAASLRAIIARDRPTAGSEAESPAAEDAAGPLAYPPATASSVEEAAESLIAEFDDLGDEWSERFPYLMELGRDMPPMPESLQTDETRVRGCLSTVFLHARKKPGTKDVVEFLAASDALVVKGLLALLQHLFSGQHAKEILDFDVMAFFSRLGLDRSLLTSRRNGMVAMVNRLQSFARELTS